METQDNEGNFTSDELFKYFTESLYYLKIQKYVAIFLWEERM